MFKTHNARVKINESYYTDSSTTLGYIYLSRDPRDIVISYSNYMEKNLDETIDFLLKGQIMEKRKINNKMPEIILNWRDNYLSWKKFNTVPSLFIKYEDLLNNLESEIIKIINFFYNNFKIKIENQENKIQKIIETTKFENLKKQELQFGFPEDMRSSFFRVGLKDQWVNLLNKKQLNIIEHTLKEQMEELNNI